MLALCSSTPRCLASSTRAPQTALLASVLADPTIHSARLLARTHQLFLITERWKSTLHGCCGAAQHLLNL